MDFTNLIIQEDISVIDAAAVINKNGKQVVFICDKLKLQAVLTDSDIRRYILRGGNLSASVSNAANYNPTKLTLSTKHRANELLRATYSLRGIPIVNEKDELISIIFADNTSIYKTKHLNIPVVIMAGGKGSRLAPFTDVLPKPLIPVSDKTITEHIMEKFISFGCNDFSMIVNYKKELIKAYFNETPCEGNLTFIDEEEFLGTGGGLKLLEGKINTTFFLSNCDILVDADYSDILKHHKDSKVLITMVCVLKKVSVPYGTVELDESGSLVKLTEKPEFPLLTNTGLYVVEPGFIGEISNGESVDITELIQRLTDNGRSVSVYPIGDNDWMDMGKPDELVKMQQKLNGAT